MLRYDFDEVQLYQPRGIGIYKKTIQINNKMRFIFYAETIECFIEERRKADMKSADFYT